MTAKFNPQPLSPHLKLDTRDQVEYISTINLDTSVRRTQQVALRIKSHGHICASDGDDDPDASGEVKVIIQVDVTESPKGSAAVSKLFWNQDETAALLGISIRALFELRQKHAFYSPDGSRSLLENPKKHVPLWSDELVKLIAFARTVTPQNTRQLDDDTALKVRTALGDNKRRQYLSHVND